MMEALRSSALCSAVLVLSLQASLPVAQGIAVPASPLMLVSREGRRPVETTILNGREVVALDQLATLFQLDIREDAPAGRMTLTFRGKTIILLANQSVALVDGQRISLSSAVARSGRRWFAPLDFLSRALAPVYGTRIDLRATARLLIVGDIHVPRVVWRIEPGNPTTRATIEITPAARVATAVETGRLLLRIDADALDLSTPSAGGGLIERIGPGDQATTIVVRLGGRAATPRVTQTVGDATTRITIDIAQVVAGAAGTPQSDTPLPLSALRPNEALAPLARDPLRRTIVIDPGHGGDDAGVRSVDGLEEKQLTLAVAHRLKSLLETRLIDVRVLLTREEDRTLGPDERSALANSNHAELFVSLHANAAPGEGPAGAEVLYFAPQPDEPVPGQAAEGAPTSLAVPGGTPREIRLIPWDRVQLPYVEASAVLAATIEEGLRQRVTMSASPIREAPLRVLAGVNMPAALVEMAYLTNPEQASAAASDTFQSAVAAALSDALFNFHSYFDFDNAQRR